MAATQQASTVVEGAEEISGSHRFWDQDSEEAQSVLHVSKVWREGAAALNTDKFWVVTFLEQRVKGAAAHRARSRFESCEPSCGPITGGTGVL